MASEKTPNGGVRDAVFYYDKDGKEVDEKNAATGMIVEYDESDKVIMRTYFEVKNE